MKPAMHEQHPSHIGAYIKDIIYGANDGIITTFAVVSGVLGAALETNTIIILGLANLIADGFSMAASNYLGSRSERAYIESEARRENREVTEIPHEELKEVEQIFKSHGYHTADAELLSLTLKKNNPFFVDFMLRYELGLTPGRNGEKLSAIFTFMAFVGAGLLPLIPFLISKNASFGVSIAATAAALFIVGSLRRFVIRRNWFLAGVEMLVIGGIAASVAYGIGFFLSRLIA